MAETTPSVSTKRPRAETESAGSDAPAASVAPASARAVRPPPTKRSKPEDAPASDFEDGDLEEPLQDHNSDTDPASDDDDDEGGLVSLAKRTKQAVGATGSSGSLKASGKRARFLIRWAGHTPEETLGSCTSALCTRTLLTSKTRGSHWDLVVVVLRPLPEAEAPARHQTRWDGGLHAPFHL